MERASLRPVPSRPQGPVAPGDAVGFVTAELPSLDEAAAVAFALVALVGRPRAEVAGSPDAAAAGELAREELAEALARARKALRRKLYPLPGSGWCERAERLISDRLDAALVDPGPARLEVHLANCDRCVEHDRRLGQAQDTLVAAFEKAHPAKEPEPDTPPAPGDVEESKEPPTLRIVDPQILPPPAPETEALPPAMPAGALPEPAEARGSEQDALLPPAAPTPSPPPAPAAMPPAASAAGPPTPAAVPSTPTAASPSAPPVPAASSYTRGPLAYAAPPQPRPWSAPPSPSPWTPPPPDAWRAATPRPPLAARAALEDEDIWTSIGPLVAVLSVTVVIFVLAVLLVLG